MLSLVVVVAAAVAFPDGVRDCAPQQYNLPNPPLESTEHAASVVCRGLDCTLSATRAFKGFVLGVSAGTVGTDAAFARALSNNRCLTHRARLDVGSFNFTLTEDATVRAVVVFSGPQRQESQGVHVYAKADAVATADRDRKFLVVGGGTGGLGAARELVLRGYDVSVYEMGPATTVNFSAPISETYQTAAVATGHATLVKGSLLGTGFGGTQSINGAVYAPGSATDLAASLGISVLDASTAQSRAASMVEHTTTPPMMWQCRNASVGCDEASVPSTNKLMVRRSVAYKLPNAIKKVGGCRVLSVNATAVTVDPASSNTDCVNIEITDKMQVIVAAGALVSPELLGAQEYTGWNHYYSLDYGVPMPDKQTFTYPQQGALEINTAVIRLLNVSVAIAITMDMLPTVREKFTRGQNRTSPDFDSSAKHTLDAWHYAGTVPHTKLQVHKNVWIGDASALLTPFNCHTSMPAVAAGVSAVRSALGLLGGATSTLSIRGAAPTLFIVGAWLTVIGVLVHTIPKLKWHHYWIMPTAVAVIASGIVCVHVDDYRLQKGSYHAVLGYVVMGLLVLQVVGGAFLRYYARPAVVRWAHRLSGLLVLGALIGLYVNATTKDRALKAYTTNTDWYMYSLWAFGAITVLTLGRALIWFAPHKDTPLEALLL